MVAVFCAAVYMLMGYWLIALLTLWLGHFLQLPKGNQSLAGTLYTHHFEH